MKEMLLETCARIGIVRYGQFDLASGKNTNVYLDMRKAILDSGSNMLITKMFIDILTEQYYDIEAVGGMGYGGTPLVGSVLSSIRRPMQGFLVRKGLKEYGTQKMVEGALKPGTKCCILEDVTTTGGSVLSAAMKMVEVIGEMPSVALTVVDRGEGAVEMLASRGIKLHALLTMAELLVDNPP